MSLGTLKQITIRYKKEYFSFDLIAGLTVGIMAIPQVVFAEMA